MRISAKRKNSSALTAYNRISGFLQKLALDTAHFHRANVCLDANISKAAKAISGFDKLHLL